ncbi:hypothetical protein [Actinoplanes sp. GCM10030250]|uniref:hypothetical protein n=1 Tax=Actinoplanes sp. GCM10030250 TaxID=3273376 RepID=UPI00360BB016
MLIPERFNGPPGTGNGGWCAGVFAVAAGARAGGPPYQVTLRTPPPLETALELRDGSVLAGDTLVAEVGEATGAGAGAGVPSVSYETAVEASRSYPGFTTHPFPTCFVCGPERPGKDGLGIFPGVLPDGGTAAPWTVPDEVSVPSMWAALDCPGGWAAIAAGQAYVLGRITASVGALPAPGTDCVVTGAAVEIAGRKAIVESTVYGPGGDRLATARATWIAVIK